MLKEILQFCVLSLPYMAFGLLLSLILTRLLIFFLPLLGFVDIPRGRHQHEKPVPRGGGIAIGTAFILTVFLLKMCLITQSPALVQDAKTFLHQFILPALIILVVGVLDDRYELKSWMKLLAQIAVGALLYYKGVAITHIWVYELPMFLSLGITIFWSVLIINAFNLIDGLDGVAGGLAAISSFLLAIWTLLLGKSDSIVIIQLIFCVSCLGFLYYNFFPAKIFMGDTGSMFIGLFFACMSMRYAGKSATTAALLVPLAAVGVPMFDVMLALWRRIFRKYIKKDPDISIMTGDHDHLHHRIQKQTGGTRKTAFLIYSLSLMVCGFAMLNAFCGKQIPALTFVLLLVVFFVMIRFSSIELFDTLTSVAKGFRSPHLTFILTAMHPLLDALLVFAAFWETRIICKGVLPNPRWGVWMLSHITPFVIFLALSGIYRTYWLRVGIIQYYRLIRTLVLGATAGYIINSLICIYGFKLTRVEMWRVGGFYVVFMLLTIGLIVVERFIIHYYESCGYRRLFLRNQGKKSDLPRLLVYGGGLYCRLFITSKYCSFNNEKNVKIIGIVDDDRALRGLNVYGFNVLGSGEDLNEIFEHRKFDTIILTCEIPDNEVLQKVKEFCRKNDVKLQKFVCKEEDLI